ncbi:MAG: HDIG domain-containing protein [Verrucomicrobia bacterium]|nr:HDIG domain-containing protein [Verrucomicrobiota bacterium]
MSVRHQLKLLVGGLGSRRAGPPPPAHSGPREFLDRSRAVAIVIFVATVALIVLISSVGLTTVNVPVLPNQLATARVVANAAFTYESAERTAALREQVASRVPPVYRLDLEPYQRFDAAARELLGRLEALEQRYPAGTPLLNQRRADLAAAVEAFNAHGPYNASLEDVAAVLNLGDAKLRASLFESGLSALRDLATEGVHDDSLGSNPGSVTVYQIARPSGAVTVRPVQSLEEAMTFLRVNLAADGVPRPASLALFRLFRLGLTPNLVFDREASQRKEAEAVDQVRPVVVNVARGQTILEPGQRVTAEQYEMLAAHRRYLREHTDTEVAEQLTLLGRILLVLAMVIASVLYIRLEDPETLRSNGRLGLLALVVIVNLALVRAVYSLGGVDFFVHDDSWASTLPFVAPTALAPLIVAILIDAGSAIFMALLVSIFTGVIYGNRLDLIVLTFLASMVAIFGCREVHKRGRVVRAAVAGGLTLALIALPIGLADQVPLGTLLQQMAAATATGFLTGMAVVGVLPVLESLFKRTTDITLLELTDYNHPLLRLMQLEAPGTYHHSLVVAQLAENAANAIGANPLLARVCALFHDIGKTAHPGFFTENLRDQPNPHDGLPPAESARIIKQHVTDGVELARRHRLPRAVVEVIQQHHGTTLVRYFYNRAVEASRAPFAAPAPGTRSPLGEVVTPSVPEAGYRYDGPRPQFKESAVISLADGVEAATRSLRAVNAEQLATLIDRIVRDRMAEGQLDEAPLTFEELAKVRNSFQFTLLNMLHARVAYPAGEQTPPQRVKG